MLRRISLRRKLIGCALIAAALLSGPAGVIPTTPALVMMVVLFVGGFSRRLQFTAIIDQIAPRCQARHGAAVTLPPRGVGNAAIAGARLAGASTIIGVDLDDRKLEWARGFGATG